MRFPAGKLFFLLVFTSTLFTQTVIADELSDAVEADYDRHLGVLFEHFHRNPELSLMETRTAARLAAPRLEPSVYSYDGRRLQPGADWSTSRRTASSGLRCRCRCSQSRTGT